MSRSDDLYERARRVIPGGVHSPVRAFRSLGSRPIFVESAAGSRITDADGNSYVDFCMAFGPLILGHAHPEVRAAVDAALDRGWSYGAAESVSLELAELVTDRIDFVDSVRFVNSGTEAVMSALRLARAATGRDKIVKFAGCYHGHTDAMLIKAGSGLAGLAVPDSAGVPAGVAGDTLVAPLDDEASLTEIFDGHAHEIAAIIIEPVPANHGLLPQRAAFVQHIADLCRQNDALLIFDEVITGFRLAFGGYAQLSGIHPDLVTWGKVIGGGFPVGAIGGRRDLMEQFAPDGPVYQAGTLSANPIAMQAGLTTLGILADGAAHDRLELLGQYLEKAVSGSSAVRLERHGSLFWMLASNISNGATIRSPESIPEDASRGYARLFATALKNGVYLPPSAFEVGFLSTAHSREDIDRFAGLLDRL
ncbi:MAG: glutamate-1-semialdehyde 2,1-aminomutase [Gammaproteobacteria bacterium]|nr:glutamate-1-semialdehyde 2,1-aminomutase [Gammaproteobacteria bacterium]MBT8444244.1 glutamate-1-semialdehyde 2,1-aminomutase [Gammaproteobacteria bacterium]NND37666.1 glutamate-1-semialdehyde 2,1-aminomutase [Gammaproteobacteria bacterium]